MVSHDGSVSQEPNLRGADGLTASAGEIELIVGLGLSPAEQSGGVDVQAGRGDDPRYLQPARGDGT